MRTPRRRAWPIGLAVVLWASVAGAQTPGSQEPEIEITTAKTTTVEVAAPPTAEQAAELRERLQKAREALGALGTTVAPITRFSLTAELDRLEGLLRSRHVPCNPQNEVKRLERDLAFAAAGEAPHLKAGLHRLAYRSPLDRRLHDFAVFVPKGYAEPARRWPMIVMLHGMRSNPMRAMGRLFGVSDGALKDSKLICDRPQLEERQPAEHAALVVAPGGFGDAFFRLAGQRDVNTVVQMMTKLYRVDRRRITITGLSMGGTGAVELALQQPHLYAGVLALCGYYDRRLDSYFRGKSLQPWEQHLMTANSPVDWAVNARGLSTVLVHGSLDGPQRARALEQRYKKLGYPITLEIVSRGHDVWVPGYEGGRAFKELGAFKKGPPPKEVSFVTGRSRVRQGHWVTIQRWQDYARWARVDARIDGKQSVTVKTDNVAALRLDLPAHYLARGKSVGLSVDGTGLEVPAGRNRWVRRVYLQRAGQPWSITGKPPPPDPKRLTKRPGLAGPIEDIYFDPIVVVYGTGGGQGAVLRQLAKKIAAYDRHVDLSYPVLPDRRYTLRWARRGSLILVGNEQTNSVLARLGPRLPIRVTADEVRLGSRAVRRPNVGATWIFPNPDAPRWYVLVIGGTTPQSYKLWRKLPGLLPDYVVFDDDINSHRWHMLLGTGRSYVAAGYFDNGWQLPAKR